MSRQILVSQACFGPVQYFVHLEKAGKATIEKHSNYQRQTYRNRYRISGANGPLTLSIPVEKGKALKVKDSKVKIAYHSNWQANHWRSIVSAYNSSPFFQFYRDDIEPFFSQKYTCLFDFNLESTRLLCELLGIETEIVVSDDFQKNPADDVLDLREVIHPKKNFREMDATFIPVPYKQVFDERHGFIPNLSILDLLFNKGPEALLVLNSGIKKS